MTIIVDVANVMGSRPDGWWRDRAGAAVRLYAEVERLALSGRVVVAPEPGPPGPTAPRGEEAPPGFVLVLEGQARAAAARMPSAAPAATCGPADRGTAATGAAIVGAPATGASGPGGPAWAVPPGEVRAVLAQGSGDDTVVALARDLPGRRVVVTADRALRSRCVAAGATVMGPGWLLATLRE